MQLKRGDGFLTQVISRISTSAVSGVESHEPPEPSSLSPDPKSPEPPYRSSSSDVSNFEYDFYNDTFSFTFREFNDSQCEVVRAEILHFLAANVPIMRLNTNGNDLIVFFCNRVRLFCSRSLSDILFYIRSVSVQSC